MPPPERRTKLQTLFAVFEHFYESTEEIPDNTLGLLRSTWNSLKGSYLNPPAGVRPSQLAAGLEQGLLELPIVIGAVGSPYRARAAQALHAAIQAQYPRFLATQAARMAKIRTRGRISSESEFMLVRHAIDVSEGQAGERSALSELYGLIEVHEAKARRVV